ncbi:imidazole glycerol phosphate synthase subunit HisH [Pseudolabrys sp.]|uniref:imidazole glycerol phosphate synthase subunit HisH n=1 Tax=Pseudolabrys sp. TaxID=1960880 RepID=UPI003D147C12
MIAIIHYGLGNVTAIANVYKRLGIEAKIAETSEDLAQASRLILPGVGAFDHALDLFSSSGMRNKVEDLVMDKRIPVLGICVGMQIMAERSEEGRTKGLGWIEGEVVHMRAVAGKNELILPHMGWNDVISRPDEPLFDGLPAGNARFYFLHSFVLSCRKDRNVMAEADYGGRFVCAVHADNVVGVQFHPEKSHHSGVRLLENFGRMS